MTHITCSGNWQVLTQNRGWCRADELRAGDIVMRRRFLGDTRSRNWARLKHYVTILKKLGQDGVWR